MTTDEALRELREYGAFLLSDGSNIRVRVPRRQKTPADVQMALETLRSHKEEALLLLGGEPDQDRPVPTGPEVTPLASSREHALHDENCPNRLALDLPPGVRVVRCEPKQAPIAIDMASVVVDVEKFIRAELYELNARLCSPVQIRGGWGVYAILDRLRQVGVELELESRNDKIRATGPE